MGHEIKKMKLFFREIAFLAIFEIAKMEFGHKNYS